MVLMNTFAILLILSIFNDAFAYYDELFGVSKGVPRLVGTSFVLMADTIYIMGGRGKNSSNDDITTIKFDSNQNLVTNSFSNSLINPMTEYNAYPLGDNKTIAAVNVQYRNINITDAQGNITGKIYPSGLAFYDTSTNTWITNQDSLLLSPLRSKIMSAISPENDAIYSMGGIDAAIAEDVALPYIYRYDLTNLSSIINITAIDPSLTLNMIQGSAQMLPNGIIVIAFGMDSFINTTLVDTSYVTLFDTRKNQIYMQAVSGTPPIPRFAAGSTLGPDKSSIYYYGGGDQIAASKLLGGMGVPGLVVLDTSAWTWIHPHVPGLPAIPCVYSTLTIFQNTKLLVALGSTGLSYSNDIGVIKNVPQSREELLQSRMQWFTNNPELDQRYLALETQEKLTKEAITGITIAIIMIVVLLLVILWRHVPKVRSIISYIHMEIIWQPRSGEPFWTEIIRFLVRFIMLFLFLAFDVYSIYRSIQSPIVTQEIRTPTDVVRAPDVRFCFDGFNNTNIPLNVYCGFQNGTSCSSQIEMLDMSMHTPMYNDELGDVVCFMFLSTPSFSFIDDKMSFSQFTSTKMLFSFQGAPRLTDTGKPDDSGVIYVDMYPSGYNPNTKVYNLTSKSIENNLSDSENSQWVLKEQGFNMLNSLMLKPSVRSTASFKLIETRALRRSDPWNYVGFSSQYDTVYTVENNYKDAPQNTQLLKKSSSLLAQLALQPDAFTVNINSEQKVFTLLSALAQVGGVLSLFIAVQTILFGFRPQSPWGIVHRWSFGRLRIMLIDKLTNYFDCMGAPVPLVNPVSNRLSTEFKDKTYSKTSGYPLVIEEIDASPESKIHQLEERLQLMELLLKSYYLNDEVFRSLDQAVKHGHDVQHRNSTDKILQDNADSMLTG